MADITAFLKILIEQKNLSFQQAHDLLDTIFDGTVPEPQVAAFLTAMRIKKPTSQELAGLAGSLRKHSLKVITDAENLIDTCGTGSARVKTFNISTAAALVAAGAGVNVAKHGNRCITSKCGSADVLAELGVKIDAPAQVVAQCIEQAHIGFMFAPLFHPAMKFVQPTRRALGFGTVFNFLGPLANPANPSAQLIGVADDTLMETIIEALQILGTTRAMVVHSDGLDEISTMGPTRLLQLKNASITDTTLNPGDYGFAKADLNELQGDDPPANAKIIRQILSGNDKGCKRDIVIFNAAAAIIVANIVDDFVSAIKIAADSIDTGSAESCLDKLIKISNSKN